MDPGVSGPRGAAGPSVGHLDEPEPRERMSAVARGVASGMYSPGVRLDVLEAMRASPRVDHSLILAEYLVEPRAEELLEAGAAAIGLTAAQFLVLVGSLPELEFVVPVTAHRLTWTGAPRVGVAAHWDSDVGDFAVYEPSGGSRQVDGVYPRWSYDALFVVRPRETDGTRIGRQPDVPGPVIQDPGDGQRAAVWRMRVGGNEEVSFDVGQYGSMEEFRLAVANTLSARGIGNTGAGATADGPDDDSGSEDDDDCRLALSPGCGGGSPNPDPWGEPSTYVTKLLLRQQLDCCGWSCTSRSATLLRLGVWSTTMW